MDLGRDLPEHAAPRRPADGRAGDRRRPGSPPSPSRSTSSRSRCSWPAATRPSRSSSTASCASRDAAGADRDGGAAHGRDADRSSSPTRSGVRDERSQARLEAAGIRTPASAGEQLGLVRALPRQVEVEAAEVAVRGGLAVDRAAQVQRRDDRRRPQVEVAVDRARGSSRPARGRCRTSRSTATAAGRSRCAYAISISNRSARPAATTFLATHRAA